MKLWRDEYHLGMFKDIIALLLMDSDDWVAYHKIDSHLRNVANVAEMIATEVMLLAIYLRERSNKVPHERALQISRREMRRKLGCGS